MATMKRHSLIGVGLVLQLVLGWFVPVCTGAESAARQLDWRTAEEILARVKAPRFPKRDFDVRWYGAVGDGQVDCTAAFAQAIDACSRSGGGRVIVPPGTYLTGAIHLKSGVNLHLQRGAVVVFTTNLSAYLPLVFSRYEGTELMNYSPLVYALDQRNIAVTGRGVLDARALAAVVHPWAYESRTDVARLAEMAARGVPVSERRFGPGFKLRQNFVQPMRCEGVLIEGVTLLGSPMWTINPIYCTNVIVRNVTVVTEGPNTDGCNPDSCRDVVIEDCWFSNGDDCIAIKSGRDHDGRRVNIPTENVVVRRCRFQVGHGGVTVGSETAGGVRNVFAEKCVFNSPDLDMALRFKTNPARGGFIEDVLIRDCEILTARFGIHMTMRYGASGASEGEWMPVVGNIRIQNCVFHRLLERPIFIQGHSPQGQIRDVVIENCRFGTAAKPSVITNAVNVSVVRCRNAGLD